MTPCKTRSWPLPVSSMKTHGSGGCLVNLSFCSCLSSWTSLRRWTWRRSSHQAMSIFTQFSQMFESFPYNWPWFTTTRSSSCNRPWSWKWKHAPTWGSSWTWSVPRTCPRAVADVSRQHHGAVPSPNLQPDPMLSQATSPSERWKDVFKAMESLAPRVGNCLISMSHDMAHQVQNSCSASNASSGHLYVCRGTERFQLPLSIPDRDRNRIRYTVRLHRSPAPSMILAVKIRLPSVGILPNSWSPVLDISKMYPEVWNPGGTKASSKIRLA